MSRHLLIPIVAVVLVVPAAASAQRAAQVAVAPAAPPPAPTVPARDSVNRRREPQFAGVRITPGWVFNERVDGDGFDSSGHGWFGRIEMEAFGYKHGSRSGSEFGMLCGAEGWGSPEGGGGGLPISWFGAYRSSGGLFASLGAGWHWAIYDYVNHDGGFGIFAPMGTAAFGIDGEGYRVLADVRAQYRWEWGTEHDRFQLTAGLTLSFNDEDRDMRGRQSARATGSRRDQ